MLKIYYDDTVASRQVLSAARLPLFRGPTPEGRLEVGTEFSDSIAAAEAARADVALVPIRWDLIRDEATRQSCLSFIAAQWAAGQRSLVFNISDDPLRLSTPGAIIYQPSLQASRMDPSQTAAMPVFFDTEDIQDEDGFAVPPDAAAWSPRPSVGFCGCSGVTVRDRLKQLAQRVRGTVMRDMEPYRRCSLGIEGRVFRHQLLSALLRHPGVDTDFVVRTAFWGGAVRGDAVDPELRRRVRREYKDNLAQHPYAVAARGAGNFSYRFFEILASGRIPVFLNTDCALPFPDTIDWTRHCLWLEPRDLPNAGERLAEFHSSLGPDGLLERQRENRRLWEEKLSTPGFFRHLHADLLAHRFL